jgi:hypothetical protein
MQELVKVMERLPKASESVSDSVSDLEDNVDKAEKKLTFFGKTAAVLVNPSGGFAKFRRFMYGFGFEGFFRGLNKVTSTFEQLDIVLRKLPKTSNKLKGIFKAITPDLSIFDEDNEMLRTLRKERRNLGDVNRFRNPIGARRFELKTQRIRGIKAQRRQKVMDLFMGGSKEERRARKDAGREARRKQIEKGLEFFTKIFKNIGRAFSKLIIGALYYLVVISGILFLAYFIIKGLWPQIKKALKATWEAIKVVGKVVIAGFMVVWDGLQSIFKGLFGGGDITDVLDGLFKVIGGLLIIAVGVLATLITAALVFVGGLVVETAKRLREGIRDVFSSGSFFEGLQKAVKGILLIAAVIAAIGVFIFGLPALLALVVISGITYLLKKLKFFANGGVVNSPLQVVGERGPELVSLPQGSRVHSNRDSRKMLSGGGNTFNITINARDTSNAELRRIADEIGRMVNSKVNRSVSSRTLG